MLLDTMSILILLGVTINYQTPLPKGVILCRCVDSAGHKRL